MYDCDKVHPKGRIGPCRWGKKCHSKDCPFLHPKVKKQFSTALTCLTNRQKSSALTQQKYVSHKGGLVAVKKCVTTVVMGGGSGKPPPRKLRGMFSFILDVSSSMRGSRTEEMMDGFDFATDTIQNRKAKDLISAYAFGSRVKMVMGFTAAKCVKPAIVRCLMNKADTGGATALRDGIAMAIDSIDRKNQKDFCELMVITDGEENCSEISEQVLLEKIRSPGIKNFHLTLIYVGDSVKGVANLQTLASSCKHARVLSLNEAKGSFKKAFEKYMQQAEKRIQTWTVTETVTKVTYHKKA